MPPRSRVRARCSGTDRWACSRSLHSRPGPPASRARSPRAPPRASWAAAIRSRRSSSSASAIGSPTSRPAAARRSSTCRASSCPASQPWSARRMRRPLFVANWKMHMTAAEAVAFAEAFLPQVAGVKGVDVAIAPPFTALDRLARALAGSNVALAAQNVNPEPKGAFTGEVAPAMLAELGCRYAIVGHSERRTYYGESDAYVARSEERRVG